MSGRIIVTSGSGKCKSKNSDVDDDYSTQRGFVLYCSSDDFVALSKLNSRSRPFVLIVSTTDVRRRSPERALARVGNCLDFDA